MTLLNPDDMTSEACPQLSKSRYLSGLQCLKRLYLQTHRSELADPVSPGQQAIFDSGTSVGELAQKRFPGGALVTEEYFEHRQAERTTRRLLSDSSIPALYEPAFSFEGIRSRIDVLRRAERGRIRSHRGQVHDQRQGRPYPRRRSPGTHSGGGRDTCQKGLPDAHRQFICVPGRRP